MSELQSEVESPKNRAALLIKALLATGRTPAQLAEDLEFRVSARTIYRWAKGNHAPQQKGDILALERLAKTLGVDHD